MAEDSKSQSAASVVAWASQDQGKAEATKTVKNILVVDDEKDIVESVEIFLEADNRKITTANSPSEAFTKAMNHKYDLVITDFRMPKTHGIDLIRGIRVQKHNANTPVIIISGFVEEAQAVVGNLPNITFLSKPFTSEELVQKAEEVIAAANQPAKKPPFDVKLVNTFFQGVSVAIKNMSGIQTITSDKPYILKADQRPDVDICLNLSIISDSFDGKMSIGMPEATFKKLLRTITLDELSLPMTIELGFAEKILMPLLNETKKLREKEGQVCQVSEMKFVSGRSQCLQGFPDGATLVLPVQALVGSVYIAMNGTAK